MRVFRHAIILYRYRLLHKLFLPLIRGFFRALFTAAMFGWRAIEVSYFVAALQVVILGIPALYGHHGAAVVSNSPLWTRARFGGLKRLDRGRRLDVMRQSEAAIETFKNDPIALGKVL